MIEFHDEKRGFIFKPGIRVHWFEYGREMIIMNGGFGTLIELKKTMFSQDSLPLLIAESIIAFILCDDGQLRNIPLIDLDIEDEWE